MCEGRPLFDTPTHTHPHLTPESPNPLHLRVFCHACGPHPLGGPFSYAIGDVAVGALELTPVAVKMGQLLARHLAHEKKAHEVEAHGGVGGGEGRKEEGPWVDPLAVCTTVFTPLEYGCVGLSEKQALDQFGGPEAVRVLHGAFEPLEDAPIGLLASGPKRVGYVKIVCRAAAAAAAATAATDLATPAAAEAPAFEDEVVGLHYVGPHAGEVLQGFGVALRVGRLRGEALKAGELLGSVALHPTSAEEVVKVKEPKRAGAQSKGPAVAGC